MVAKTRMDKMGAVALGLLLFLGYGLFIVVMDHGLEKGAALVHDLWRGQDGDADGDAE